MRYEIRHVSVRSTAKFGIVVGVALAFLPSLCLATTVVQVIRRALGAIGQLSGFEINLPAVDLGLTTIQLPAVPIDLVRQLGLSSTAEQLTRLNAASALVFLFVLLFGLLFGALLVLLPMIVFSLFYNAVAPAVGGFAVDMEPRQEARR